MPRSLGRSHWSRSDGLKGSASFQPASRTGSSCGELALPSLSVCSFPDRRSRNISVVLRPRGCIRGRCPRPSGYDAGLETGGHRSSTGFAFAASLMRTTGDSVPGYHPGEHLLPGCQRSFDRQRGLAAPRRSPGGTSFRSSSFPRFVGTTSAKLYRLFLALRITKPSRSALVIALRFSSVFFRRG
ncbi:hypothetical protein BH20VER3_BH20VER3_22330 [soil metagenome]